MKKDNTEDFDFFICPKCFKKNNGKNIFGKICKFCGTWTPPKEEMKTIQENKFKLQLAQKQIIDYLRNKNKKEK